MNRLETLDTTWNRVRTPLPPQAGTGKEAHHSIPHVLETWAAAADAAAVGELKALGEALVADLDSQLSAGEQGMLHPQQRLADHEHVAGMETVLQQATDGKILAELVVRQLATRLLGPRPVVHLEDGVDRKHVGF